MQFLCNKNLGLWQRLNTDWRRSAVLRGVGWGGGGGGGRWLKTADLSTSMVRLKLHLHGTRGQRHKGHCKVQVWGHRAAYVDTSNGRSNNNYVLHGTARSTSSSVEFLL